MSETAERARPIQVHYDPDGSSSLVGAWPQIAVFAFRVLEQPQRWAMVVDVDAKTVLIELSTTQALYRFRERDDARQVFYADLVGAS